MDRASSNLARQVAERQAFLEKVINFIESVMEELGTVTYREVHNWHTNTKVKLLNFNDFSFHMESGRTQFGGNSITAWYHPESNSIITNNMVLEVGWQSSPAECVVEYFNSSERWQRAIKTLMENKTAVIKRFKKARAEEEKKEKDNNERLKKETEAKQKLLKDAKRLGLAPSEKS